MSRPLHPRSRSFAVVLGMALLAWTMLATGALVGPLHMIDATGMTADFQVAQPPAVAVHCNGLAMTHASHPAPMHPAGHGHGCCHASGCYCASLCSGIAGVAAMAMTWPPIHDAMHSLTQSEPVLAHSAPPLRPPIA